MPRLHMRAQDHIGRCPVCRSNVFITYDLPSLTDAVINCAGGCFRPNHKFATKQMAVYAWTEWQEPPSAARLKAETAKLLARMERAADAFKKGGV